MEFKKLPVSKLTMNTGQIEGVPANPRQWTQADLDRLAASIEETPELLDARGAIVVPHKGKFVVLGGNMRLTAAKKLGLAEMPCAVLPEDTPAEKMKEIVIKDNLSVGEWDMDALANEWDDLPLTDWGVPFVPNVEQEVEARALAVALNVFLDSLSGPERRVFVSRYWLFLSISEIADRQGFSESKIKSMLFRTRKKLRQTLREEAYL